MTDTIAHNPSETDTEVQPQPEMRARPVLAILIVLAAACYRPIAFWVSNAGDLPSLTKTIIVAAGTALAGALGWVLLVRLGLRPLVAGLAMGSTLMVIINWEEMPGAVAPLLLGLVFVLAWLAQRSTRAGWVEVVSLSFLAAFGAVPLAQVATALFQGDAPYPVVTPRQPVSAQASGDVEDVVMVVLDSYPNLQIAASWFEHRPDELVENLESRGFTVERGAWSRHTFTSLSVPSILQLGSVIEPGPTGHWNDRSSLWRILRGDNFVSQTLGSAGFTYTHIESGWAGTSCGPEVDRCIPSPWIDEQVWLMLQPTIAGRWADQRHHFLTGTMNTAESLKTGLEALTGNGKHDYLFAHFLLPHEPILVDAQCRPLRDPLEQGNDPTTRAAAIGDQMECVDKLVMSAIDAVDDDTAVLLTADHGSGISNQVGRPPDEWSDAGIAERFSIFLSHKIPAPCESPDLADPMSAMAAIVGCAVGQEFPLAGPEYLIGAEDPVAVEPERMARIKQEVANGTLAPQISQGLPESSEGTHQGETLSP